MQPKIQGPYYLPVAMIYSTSCKPASYQNSQERSLMVIHNFYFYQVQIAHLIWTIEKKSAKRFSGGSCCQQSHKLSHSGKGIKLTNSKS